MDLSNMSYLVRDYRGVTRLRLLQNSHENERSQNSEKGAKTTGCSESYEAMHHLSFHDTAAPVSGWTKTYCAQFHWGHYSLRMWKVKFSYSGSSFQPGEALMPKKSQTAILKTNILK